MNDHPILNKLSRRLSSRRITLRLAAGSLAGLLFASESDEASARCRRVGSRCRSRRDCCEGARCRRDRCKCRPGRVKCDNSGRCVNRESDSKHCGSCNNTCADDRNCNNGVCCKIGEIGCNGACCSRLEECLPKGASDEDVCCPASSIFVLCDEGYIEESEGHFLCFAPAEVLSRLRRICCPPESICGDYCCEPAAPDQISICEPGQLICQTAPTLPASYVRPGRRPQ